MGPYRSQCTSWVLMGPYRLLCVFMVFNGSFWVLMRQLNSFCFLISYFASVWVPDRQTDRSLLLTIIYTKKNKKTKRLQCDINGKLNNDVKRNILNVNFIIFVNKRSWK